VRAQGLLAAGPVLVSDGDLAGFQPSVQDLEELESLVPYGRGFEPPLFHGRFEVLSARKIGQDGSHLLLELRHVVDGWHAPAVWFRYERDLRPGDVVRLVVDLQLDRYRPQQPIVKLFVRRCIA
ncbi:MAG: hypothetical protein D6791_18205, partial [Chloroflexi bacterium]